MKIKDDFKIWMRNRNNCPNLGVDTPDVYILYLNGLFDMLYEMDFLPFHAWETLERVDIKDKEMCKLITDAVSLAIKNAENSSSISATALRNFKTAFKKLAKYLS